MRSVGLEIGRPAVGSTREGQPHPLGRGGLQVGAAGAELSPKGSQGPSAEADRPVRRGVWYAGFPVRFGTRGGLGKGQVQVVRSLHFACLAVGTLHET